MKSSTTTKAIVFLALAFGISWTVCIGGWAAGAVGNPALAFATVTGMMFGPSIAALVCVIAFERGRRRAALGLFFGANWWWLWAWVLALAIAFGATLVTALAGRAELVDFAQNYFAQARLAAPEQAAAIDQAAAIPGIGWLILAQGLVIGTVFNTIALTISEELGWRGYLYDLWRRFGFLRYTIATGAIWGLWHAPAIYLFGLNYPDHRLVGIPIFVAFCILYSFPFTLVRDRGKSVIAAAILHGTGNAVAGLAMLMLSRAEFPWAGVVGIGGFAMLSLAAAASWAIGGRERAAALAPEASAL
jgi:hypothetical protein